MNMENHTKSKHSKKSKKRVSFRQPSKLDLSSESETPSPNSEQPPTRVQKKSLLKKDSSNESSSICFTPSYIKEKFITVIDHLDAEVDKFRLETTDLIKKHDFLLTCIDLLNSDDQMQQTSAQQDQISHFNKRLNRVLLQVSTIRDNAQEKSLAQVNELINSMIGMLDAKRSFQCCQIFLNTFDNSKSETGLDNGPIDRNFESALLGCTIDDQREIKARLEALLDYMKTQNTA